VVHIVIFNFIIARAFVSSVCYWIAWQSCSAHHHSSNTFRFLPLLLDHFGKAVRQIIVHRLPFVSPFLLLYPHTKLSSSRVILRLFFVLSFAAESIRQAVQFIILNFSFRPFAAGSLRQSPPAYLFVHLL
jgi:hypothetical protein